MAIVSVSFVILTFSCAVSRFGVRADVILNEHINNNSPNYVFELNKRLDQMEDLRAKDAMRIDTLVARIEELEDLHVKDEIVTRRKIMDLEKHHAKEIWKLTKRIEDLINIHAKEISELTLGLAESRAMHETHILDLTRCVKDLITIQEESYIYKVSDLGMSDSNVNIAAADDNERKESSAEMKKTFPKVSHRSTNLAKDEAIENNTIAFSAAPVDVISDPGSGQTVIFGNVFTNFGATYSSTSGIFTSTRRGVYIFFWTIEVANPNFISTELVRNGMAIGEITVTGSNDWRVASNMLSVELVIGDEVWVRVDGHSLGADIQKSGTCFTGFLLH
ncbi:uncharacterized protein LOC117343388 [Pecten maximus]|uniref:uncharacterized protein LOC117343388 n=1 Tax=Pecten maximus TaxID=6579 RepID=UPI001458E635|nr:uncharacterized protein LOC117343388 [Pecten maximus]